MSALSAPVWVVAGAPGAGKSTVARSFAATVQPPAALLDKDTMYAGFVEATLAAAGRPFGEREGAWYDEHIKVHEYAGMTATARQVRASGCPVVLCAPYSAHIRSQARWDQFVGDLGGPLVHLLWVRCRADVLRSRLVDRASPRDGEKLLRYEQFVAAVQPDVEPIVPHYTIDNSAGDVAQLVDAARRAAMSYNGSGLQEATGPREWAQPT
jgi:predicted kinase